MLRLLHLTLAGFFFRISESSFSTPDLEAFLKPAIRPQRWTPLTTL
jgi:hypothetical protein